MIQKYSSSTYVIEELDGQKIVGTFHEKKSCKRQIKQNLDARKVEKNKTYELYVKWKGYDN